MNTIPVIDISTIDTPQGRKQAAAAIYDAIVDAGFFQIVGHGVPMELIDRAYAMYDNLFDRPDEYKEALESPNGNPFRGYFRAERAANAGSRVESYEIASIATPEEAQGLGIDPAFADFFEPWAWPDIDGFADTLLELRDRTRGVGATVMSLFATALGLPDNYFTRYVATDGSNFMCRYYSTTSAVTDQNVLLDEHQDSGMLTVLHQRGTYEGLQVLCRDGERITVPVRDDAYVINVGRLMTRWTNDLFPSTPHRVIDAPTADDFRRSIVLFYMPSPDAVITPIARCVGADGPHYEPITPYEAQKIPAKELQEYGN